MADAIAAAFNNDPGSPVPATVVQGAQLPAGEGEDWEVHFVSKATGTSSNYVFTSSGSPFGGTSGKRNPHRHTQHRSSLRR